MAGLAAICSPRERVAARHIGVRIVSVNARNRLRLLSFKRHNLEAF